MAHWFSYYDHRHQRKADSDCDPTMFVSEYHNDHALRIDECFGPRCMCCCCFVDHSAPQCHCQIYHVPRGVQLKFFQSKYTSKEDP